MKIIEFDKVVSTAEELCGRAACDLPPDVLKRIAECAEKETTPHGREFFRQYLENAAIAARERLPLCQDTGFAVWFVEYGTNLAFDRGDIYEALAEGTRRGYKRFYLRKSILKDTVFDRSNTFDNTPPVVHLRLVPGDKLVGIYKSRIAGAGNVAMFMQSTTGLIVCVLLPIILLVGYDLIRRRIYEKGKKKDTDALMAELEALRAEKAKQEENT